MKEWIQKNWKALLKGCMPLIITILTVFIGNLCVIQPFQEKQWREQHKLERKNEKQREAIKYFETLSDLMDKRLFLTRQYFWAINSKNQKNIKTKNKNLQNFLNKWNTQLNKNIVKIAVYFQNENYTFDIDECNQHCSQKNKKLCECSDEQKKSCLNKRNVETEWAIENEWECNIHLNFRCIYEKTLKDYKRHSSNRELRAIAKDQLDCLNQRIYQFNKNILELIIIDKANKGIK